MIIVDKALMEREAEGRPIRVGIVGGVHRSRLANQLVNSTRGMRLVAASNATATGRSRRSMTQASKTSPSFPASPS
jgi:predicted homoserine dehydrogenase-like protein